MVYGQRNSSSASKRQALALIPAASNWQQPAGISAISSGRHIGYLDGERIGSQLFTVLVPESLFIAAVFYHAATAHLALHLVFTILHLIADALSYSMAPWTQRVKFNG